MEACVISRRKAITLLFTLSVTGFARSQTPGTDYVADVEFLLKEFERQAGHLLKLKGVDWKAVSERFRTEAQQVRDNVAHVKLCNRLVAQLHDGHAGIISLNKEKVQMPDESGGRRFTGPRVHLVVIGEKVFVRQAFGSAAEAGVQVGMEVLSIDDTPIRKWLDGAVARLSEERGYSTSHTALYYACHTGLADWAGTPIRFLLSQGDQQKTVTLTRSGGPNFVPIGPVFPPKEIKAVGRQSYGRTAGGYGYIHLRDVPENLPAQLDRMLAEIGDTPGLILDMRANGGGGCDHEAVFGRFVPLGKKWRQYTGAGAKPYVGPMVVIVDAGVRSAGETVAGMFKEDGRALMIGDTPTAGTSSQKTTVTVPSGLLTVRFSIASNKGRFNGGRGIEGIGVPPHEVTPYLPADLQAGVDTQIRRAEEILKVGIPKDTVPWDPAIP